MSAVTIQQRLFSMSQHDLHIALLGLTVGVECVHTTWSTWDKYVCLVRHLSSTCSILGLSTVQWIQSACVTCWDVGGVMAFWHGDWTVWVLVLVCVECTRWV